MKRFLGKPASVRLMENIFVTNVRECVTMGFYKRCKYNLWQKDLPNESRWQYMFEHSLSVLPNDNFLDFRLFRCGREQCEPARSFGPFARSHYLFYYVLSGKGSLLSTDSAGAACQYDLCPGQGFLLCPGQVNTYRADDDQPWSYVWVEFDGLRAANCLDAAGLGPAQPIYRPQSAAGGEHLRERMLCISGQTGASSVQMVGYLCLFLDELAQTSSTRQEQQNGPQRDFYIQEAVAFIQQNYQRDISVEEIAGICKLNRSYFSKLFKEVIGITPQDFIIRLRLTRAAEQMRTTNDSIGNIARRCGYPNQLHFSQAFKKFFGLPPREWRKKNKRKD